MNVGIQKLFSEVPRTYELVNHVLTFGFDILWRRTAAKVAVSGGGTQWLDLCSGTGEMALSLRQIGGDEVTVVAADFSLPMLRHLKEKPEAENIVLTLAEASQLPFPNNTFDLGTLSFATRNIKVSRDDLIQCFREFHRIIKPGGRFVILETSQPPSRCIRWLIHTYVRLFVRPVGFIISGSRTPYAYLSRTIRRFYEAEELSDIIKQAGFSEVTFKRLLFGITAIHKALK
ncbi:MAG: ubiquinone/menaquinone biosynthesis methyltransferase [Gemmatimonadota bacterium]|nr:MAG: ubiquinone/menaquinone biosynthesis methyltransferase [Gemmatimonadota bacterium]